MVATSAILLSQLIYKRLATKCEPNLDNSKIYDWHLPPAELERELNDLVKRVTEEIMSETREIKTYEDIHKIALISTNNNEEMAELISGIYMEMVLTYTLTLNVLWIIKTILRSLMVCY